jgi:hypothetical protein
MAYPEQYPLAKALVCPYNDCDSTEIESIGGASEMAGFTGIDSNKVAIEYSCKKCNRQFVLHYHFEK